VSWAAATIAVVGKQLGYDEMAPAYDDAFPTGYGSAAERHAIALFADDRVATGLSGPVVDVGCETGHITHDLSSHGLDVMGIDPSTAMLALAQRRYPDMRWRVGDASLRDLPEGRVPLAGIVARFSLIHVEPDAVPGILST
jgi:trans-aconitate methyltransferase